ncbi:hypothetical protein [Pedobacter sp. UBA5917]|jgi:pimeloyl-ACP methyl ester carboxylesterase|uniref:hypothetical protein n=1 Tax=Pedobacter sp. UBA5917 TaxID=1947061 RepID=UPI0025EA1295|nr:hypothetical protein [Pedobacter sp. UBA5917]
MPFAVITGTSVVLTKGFKDESVKKEYQDLVAKLQADFLKLSTNSWLVKAEKSGHIIQASEPEIVVDQIRKVLGKRN